MTPKTLWWRQKETWEKSAQRGYQLVKQELVTVPKSHLIKLISNQRNVLSRNGYCGSRSFNLLQAHEQLSLRRIVPLIFWKTEKNLPPKKVCENSSLMWNNEVCSTNKMPTWLGIQDCSLITVECVHTFWMKHRKIEAGISKIIEVLILLALSACSAYISLQNFQT